jgi:hypothetical protein
MKLILINFSTNRRQGTCPIQTFLNCSPFIISP